MILVEFSADEFLLAEKDAFGQALTEHAQAVLRHLGVLYLGDDFLAAVNLASSENSTRVKVRVHEARAKLGEPVVALFDQLYRARAIANKAQRATALGTQPAPNSIETLRKLLIGLSSDLRMVIALLYSRLETLRFHAQNKLVAPTDFAQETLNVYGPLANRLGMWSLKWELEDLAFRYADGVQYKKIAAALASKRIEREKLIFEAVEQVKTALTAAHLLAAQVTGRPKHIYSIFNKMRAKALPLEQIQDLLALRIVVDSQAQCYEALSVVHAHWPSVAGEYDDYIGKPKENGYKSLHTVIFYEPGQAIEVQIRTREMHEFAEYGAAAHWRYKEASTGTGQLAPQENAARKLSWVRQLMAWQQELGQALNPDFAKQSDDHPILVLTPEAKIIELPRGATAVDFAYHVHTNLGHRCRGARVDGVLVPLSRPLITGQVIDIIVAKRNEAVGPSRDWLNPELGFLASHRARTKVRVWFNEQQELAQPAAQAQVQPKPINPTPTLLRRPAATKASGQVLVVGVDLLLTQLARCCRPIPPDAITGYVTRGKGVSIHRSQCASLRSLCVRSPDRVLETAWDPKTSGLTAADRFNVDVQIEGVERPTLLRDITEIISREKVHVSALTSQVEAGVIRVRATLAVENQAHLNRALRALSGLKGVLSARRR